MPDAITAAALQQRLKDEQLTVLDVRSRAEYERDGIDPVNGDSIHRHIEAIRAAPEDTIASIADRARYEPVVVACWQGSCSQAVAALLAEHGVDACYLGDGMATWPPDSLGE